MAVSLRGAGGVNLPLGLEVAMPKDSFIELHRLVIKEINALFLKDKEMLKN